MSDALAAAVGLSSSLIITSCRCVDTLLVQNLGADIVIHSFYFTEHKLHKNNET